MKLLEEVHRRFVHPSRVRTLSSLLAGLIPADASVLDVGCGDGRVGRAVSRARPDIDLAGLDTTVREGVAIPVAKYDGRVIPHERHRWDVVLLVDVLHHADDPMMLLREAVRVSRVGIVVKDHVLEGPFARPLLRFMDVVGNRRHAVALPCNYWTREQWREAFASLSLEVVVWNAKLGLYPFPANWIFERNLHFVARLDRRPSASP